MLEVTEKCSTCNGTGVQPLDLPGGGSRPCFMCGTTGRRVISAMDISDIVDTINDILDKVNDIKEKVDEL